MEDEIPRRPAHPAASANGAGGAPVERPLRTSEVLAETVRLYGDRFWAAVGLGVVSGGFFVAAGLVPELVAIPLLSVAVTCGWAAATRLVAGDSFSEAWSQVAVRAPALAVFTVTASLPFALAVSQLFLILFAVAWLALTGFSIPVAMVERPPEGQDFIHRLGFGLQRSIRLARAEYLHAVGVIAVLVIVYVVFALLLAGLLVGFAENSGGAALTLVTVVLAPFFFLGLAVLYYDQRARAEGRRPLAHEVP
jgi:hypothetical protein